MSGMMGINGHESVTWYDGDMSKWCKIVGQMPKIIWYNPTLPR